MKEENIRTQYRRFNFSKEVAEKLNEAEFYKRTPDKNGELKRNDRYYFLALSLLNFISSQSKKQEQKKEQEDDDGKYVGSRILKEFSEDNYRVILNELIRLEIVIELEKPTHRNAGKYSLNKIYSGNSRIRLTEDEANLIDIKFRKQTKRGIRATTDSKILVEIDFETFYQELKDYDIEEKSIKKQWKIIQKINSTGTINPRQYRESRLYSYITELSKPVAKYISIDGNKELSEIDLHATYFLLLPAILKKHSFKKKDEKLEYDIERLNNWLNCSEDIYQQIALEINRYDITRKEIKTNVVSWLCSPDNNKFNKIQKMIDKWFSNNFPECHNALNLLRNNKLYSRRAMSLEQSIFVSVSKQLKKISIDCITKHDCILFQTKDSAIVTDHLLSALSKNNVQPKFSTVNYNSKEENLEEIWTSKFQKSQEISKIAGPQIFSETPILSDFEHTFENKTAHSEDDIRRSIPYCAVFENNISGTQEITKAHIEDNAQREIALICALGTRILT